MDNDTIVIHVLKAGMSVHISVLGRGKPHNICILMIFPILIVTKQGVQQTLLKPVICKSVAPGNVCP